MSAERAIRLASRMAQVKASPTVSLMDQARALRAAGRDVIGLAGGEPDFESPGAALDAASKALQTGMTHYVSSQGLPAFRNAIAEKLARENGIAYDPETEVVVTVGGKMALLSALLALVDPGSEVLTFGPAWVSYEPMVTLAGGRLVEVPLTVSQGRFIFDEAALRVAVTPNSRALILNDPHNPTGKVFTSEELVKIAAVAQTHNLVVITDEIYEHICFDRRRHLSIAALPGMRERTVTTNSLSKGYAMPGWRLGYAAADAAVVRAMVAIQQQTTTCAVAFAQVGGAAVLSGIEEEIAAMTALYQERRDFLRDRFQSMKGLEFLPPEGTFYAFPRHSPTFGSSADLAARLLEEAGLVVVPGSAFGSAGEGHLRLSFACSMSELEKAADRLAAFFS